MAVSTQSRQGWAAKAEALRNQEEALQVEQEALRNEGTTMAANTCADHRNSTARQLPFVEWE